MEKQYRSVLKKLKVGRLSEMNTAMLGGVGAGRGSSSCSIVQKRARQVSGLCPGLS